MRRVVSACIDDLMRMGPSATVGWVRDPIGLSMGSEPSVDAELVPWLNMLKTSQGLVLVEGTPREEPRLEQLEFVPVASGMVWLAGRIHMANGESVDAILRAHANGGELHGIYLHSDASWHEVTEDSVSRVLGLRVSDVFPLDYEFAVPLESDHSH